MGGWPTLCFKPEGAPFLSRFVRKGGSFRIVQRRISEPPQLHVSVESHPCKERKDGAPGLFF